MKQKESVYVPLLELNCQRLEVEVNELLVDYLFSNFELIHQFLMPLTNTPYLLELITIELLIEEVNILFNAEIQSLGEYNIQN